MVLKCATRVFLDRKSKRIDKGPKQGNAKEQRNAQRLSTYLRRSLIRSQCLCWKPHHQRHQCQRLHHWHLQREMLSSQSLDDGGYRGQRDWFSKSSLHSLSCRGVAKLSRWSAGDCWYHGEGCCVKKFALRVMHHRGSRSGAPVVEIGKSRGTRGQRGDGDGLQEIKGNHLGKETKNLPPAVLLLPAPKPEPVPKPLLWLFEPNPPNPKDMMSVGVVGCSGSHRLAARRL
jgi:hypothetical protein